MSDTTSDAADPLQGARVLVVDGHAPSRLQVAALLRERGCQPGEASNTEAALSLLAAAVRQGNPFRAVLLDLALAEATGEAICWRIHARPELKGLALIGMGQGSDAQRREAGLAACVGRPVRQDDLYECLTVALDRNPDPEAAAFTPHIPEIQKNRMRVLMAEDNRSNQEVARAILAKLGYRADVVANGNEVLSALRAMPYDLILMDCQMPEMNGYEAAARIRDPQSDVFNPNIPIIALTAYAMQGDREACLAAGMNDYLSKPIHPGILAAVLEKWLPWERSAAAPAPEEAPDETALFDEKALRERVMGDHDLLRIIVDGFVEDIPKQLDALASHLGAGAVDAIERVAHSIRGAASTVGAGSLQRVAFDMEKAAKSGDIAALRAGFPGLNREFHATRRVMTKQAIESRERSAAVAQDETAV